MLQSLSIVLAQVKSGNKRIYILLNEIRQIIYSLCRAKEISKTVLSNIMNSIKVITQEWILCLLILKIVKHRLLLNLIDNISLKTSDKYVALSSLSIQYTWKNILKSCKNNTSKISNQTWNEEFELPHGSHFVSDIQDSFEYLKKMENTQNEPSKFRTRN